MLRQIGQFLAAIDSLATACLAMPGRLAEARRCAMELAAHHRILVQTLDVTEGGKQVVLRTRIRIIGDAQTDILRCWMQRANPDTAQAIIRAHFEAVAARTGDLGSLRTLARGIHATSWLVLAVLTVKPVLPVLETQDWSNLLPSVLEHWHWPLAGVVLPVLYQVTGWILRRRLLRAFSRGLTA